MDFLLTSAIKAAVNAGEEIMKIYENDIEVTYKSDNSPLTIADRNANLIIDSLLKTTNIPIISEETNQIDYSIRSCWDTCWIVDPLDGTKEFIKRNGEFTVNIALVKKNTPVLGVIYVPFSKTLYYANVTAKKAYKINLKYHEYSKELFGSDKDEIYPTKGMYNQIKVIGSRSHKSLETDNFIDKLKQEGAQVELVSVGSSLKFCRVAEGNAEIYPRFAPTMEWDTAAGHAICNAVGLKVMKVDGSEELQYNKENLLNPYFIVKK